MGPTFLPEGKGIFVNEGKHHGLTVRTERVSEYIGRAYGWGDLLPWISGHADRMGNPLEMETMPKIDVNMQVPDYLQRYGDQLQKVAMFGGGLYHALKLTEQGNALDAILNPPKKPKYCMKGFTPNKTEVKVPFTEIPRIANSFQRANFLDRMRWGKGFDAKNEENYPKMVAAHQATAVQAGNFMKQFSEDVHAVAVREIVINGKVEKFGWAPGAYYEVSQQMKCGIDDILIADGGSGQLVFRRPDGNEACKPMGYKNYCQEATADQKAADLKCTEMEPEMWLAFFEHHNLVERIKEYQEKGKRVVIGCTGDYRDKNAKKDKTSTAPAPCFTVLLAALESAFKDALAEPPQAVIVSQEEESKWGLNDAALKMEESVIRHAKHKRNAGATEVKVLLNVWDMGTGSLQMAYYLLTVTGFEELLGERVRHHGYQPFGRYATAEEISAHLRWGKPSKDSGDDEKVSASPRAATTAPAVAVTPGNCEEAAMEPVNRREVFAELARQCHSYNEDIDSIKLKPFLVKLQLGNLGKTICEKFEVASNENITFTKAGDKLDDDAWRDLAAKLRKASQCSSPTARRRLTKH